MRGVGDLLTRHILTIIPEDPPDGIGGVRSKILGLLPALNGLIDVYVMAYGNRGRLSQDPGAVHSISQLPTRPRTLPRRTVALLSRRFPSSAVFDNRSLTSALLSHFDTIGAPEVIHVEGTMLLHHGAAIRRLLRTLGAKSTLLASISDSHSLALRGRASLGSLARSHLALSIERHSYVAFDCIHVVSVRDREWLNRKAPTLRVEVVPLGVTLPVLANDTPEPNSVGHLGSLGGLAGREVARFLTSSWRLVHSSVPSAQLFLAGTAPAKSLEDIIDITPAVSYVGLVPDGDAFLQSCAIAIAPSQQLAGMPSKALQAMGNCRAVAGGRVLSGIPGGRHGVHYLQGDTPADLAQAISRLLLEPQLRFAIANNGRLLAERLSWEGAAEVYLRSVVPPL